MLDLIYINSLREKVRCFDREHAPPGAGLGLDGERALRPLDKAGAVAATASKECRLDHIVDDAIDARIDGPMKTRANCEQAQPAWVPIARSAPSLTARLPPYPR
jgi:hypothetical protein